MKSGVASGLAIVAVGLALFAGPVAADPHFNADDIQQGHAQFDRTCAQCHGRNMVNSGTTVYDLRRFPVDDPDRFFNSVTNGKGNMPSFKGALTPEQMKLLWAYIGSRGGKEP
jgi:mono/diheme cytochrome c family protein